MCDHYDGVREALAEEQRRTETESCIIDMRDSTNNIGIPPVDPLNIPLGPSCPTKALPTLDLMKGKVDKGDKYRKDINGVKCDVYDVLKAFEVTNPAMQHAIKKMLCAGDRGYKDFKQDAEEAIVSIERAIELEAQ